MTERKVSRTCEQCGTEFSVIPSRLKHGRGKHCSPACQYAAIKARPKKTISLMCIGCERPFTRNPSQLKARGGGKYCTRACRDKHWIGEKNPCWQNGEHVYKRGSRWHAIKRRIRSRDGCCTECGSTQQLHVHHKIPFRIFASEEAANAEWNLITLCAPCHRKEDARHKWVGFESGAILRFPSGGVAWQMARERGMV